MMEKRNLNQIVNEKLKKVENTLIPGSNWNKQVSWNKIRDILDTKNKKLVLWYFATAASISLGFSAVLNDNFNLLKSSLELLQSPEKVVSETKQNSTSTVAVERNEFEVTELTPKQLPVVSHLDEFSNQNTLSPSNQTSQSEREYVSLANSRKNEILREKSITLRPNISLSSGAGNMNGINPALELDIRFKLKGTPRKSSYLGVGIQSSIHNLQSDEISNQQIYPATFVSAKYGQIKKSSAGKKKSWEVEASYLINPDYRVYDDTTFRFQYTHSIVGKLRGGPELLFTNRFRKVYPGFTLVFG